MSTMGKLFLALVLIVSAAAVAQDVRISQKNKAFSVDEISVKVGEKIVFVNDDSVAHNVYTIVGGSKKDLGLQKPNQEGAISFDKAGTYRVRCAIHPRMKLTVTVG